MVLSGEKNKASLFSHSSYLLTGIADLTDIIIIGNVAGGDVGIRVKDDAGETAGAAATGLLGTMTEEEALAPFPGLDTAEEQQGLDDDDGPLPGDAGVFEDVVVDDGAVQDQEDGHVAEHDRVEEELVAPHVVHPLRKVLLRLGLHAEERASEIDQLPRQEE